MPVPAHRHRETFSHLIGSYATSYMEGSQPFMYRCAPRGTRTGHCPTGISKSIISNDYKNEEAGHGPVPKDIQTRSLFLQQCNSFVKIIQDSIESRI